MFSDSKVEVSGFPSEPEKERSVSDGSSQTLTLETSNESTQTAVSQSASAQADAKILDYLLEPPSYDADKLLKFLQRITPHLEEELKDLESSTDGLNFNDETKTDIEKEAESERLPSKQISIQPDCCKEKVISSVSWNSTGTLLAISYSEKVHEGWCNHETTVCVYNTGKPKFEKNPPEHSLKTSACVECIQFHPYIPSLLAGGLYSGEVKIWDLKNDEPLMTNVKTRGDNEGHVNAVTVLVWREDRVGLWLVTAGKDGKVIFWKVATTNLTYEAHDKYLILKQSLKPLSNILKEYHEVLSISFWPHKETDFVVAAGKSIFHCSSRTAKSLISAPEYKDPISLSYTSHEGLVTGVDSSATTDLFASCGIDSRIQIFKCESSASLHVIYTNYPVMGIQWSKSHSCLVSWGCSSTAEKHRINVDEGAHESTNICKIEQEISVLALNLARHGKMAAGTTTGEVLLFNDVSL